MADRIAAGSSREALVIAVAVLSSSSVRQNDNVMRNLPGPAPAGVICGLGAHRSSPVTLPPRLMATTK
ncbi:hypothetical protein [Vineibacter terrae]|uniref:hypothetical protein n=1 Tax=Vineibacter terrae TaxID=2586908 RepID=UPI002E320C7C|nr:hypothetical protein [Vineibacter terrae]HEX2889727.1 hypothetical protein [Vineibacter terrae]